MYLNERCVYLDRISVVYLNWPRESGLAFYVCIDVVYLDWRHVSGLAACFI